MASRTSVVAVTGASGYVGSRLLRELEREESLSKVVAIDTRPLPAPYHNVAAERIDVTEPLDDAFREHEVDTVVHLAFSFRSSRSRGEAVRARQENLRGVGSVLEACLEAKVRKLIYLSSHTVYGAWTDNPVPITEDAPLRPTEAFQYCQDKALCEGEIQRFARENPQVCVTVLRCCVVMGPNADNFVTRALFKPLLLGVRGYDPPLQLVHENDLAKLLYQLVMEPHGGTFNVAGEGVVFYSELARISRRRLVSLPAAVAYPLTQMAWNLGVQKDSPSVGLNFVRYAMILSTGQLKKETGFRFYYTSEDALRSYVSGRAA